MATALQKSMRRALAGCSTAAANRASILFDDFNYSSPSQLANHGWIVRTEQGWPGVPGALGGNESISFADDPASPGNRILRLSSSTDGNGMNTRQAQICHQRKYLEGRYAARVRFTDDPAAGTTGDQVVETFYMISPLKAPTVVHPERIASIGRPAPLQRGGRLGVFQRRCADARCRRIGSRRSPQTFGGVPGHGGRASPAALVAV